MFSEESFILIGERLRGLTDAKKLSQGDIEERTGLHRCYISRVENGHTVPALETLEKFSRALQCPLYQVFYDDTEAAIPLKLPAFDHHNGWGSTRKDTVYLSKLRKALARMAPNERKLLLHMAQKVGSKSR